MELEGLEMKVLLVGRHDGVFVVVFRSERRLISATRRVRG